MVNLFRSHLVKSKQVCNRCIFISIFIEVVISMKSVIILFVKLCIQVGVVKLTANVSWLGVSWGFG